jgi:hypothetical protein
MPPPPAERLVVKRSTLGWTRGATGTATAAVIATTSTPPRYYLRLRWTYRRRRKDDSLFVHVARHSLPSSQPHPLNPFNPLRRAAKDGELVLFDAGLGGAVKVRLRAPPPPLP